ncbi:hypothetical protein [Geobacter argillaceus]|uniref:hypothetical protein n=1 Tax=Geobacter argillaceus TaxID=345631 RepID=UPI0011A7F088|nr:hypothetical protein [Geobacter argillaceus]
MKLLVTDDRAYGKEQQVQNAVQQKLDQTGLLDEIHEKGYGPTDEEVGQKGTLPASGCKRISNSGEQVHESHWSAMRVRLEIAGRKLCCRVIVPNIGSYYQERFAYDVHLLQLFSTLSQGLNASEIFTFYNPDNSNHIR